MKKTARMKQLKKRKFWLTLINYLLCYGTAVFLVLLKVCGAEAGTPLKETLGTVVYGFIVAQLPLIAITAIVGTRIKPVVWMVNVVMANIVFGGPAIYFILGIWLVDEYIICPIANNAKIAYISSKEYAINKEQEKNG